jgi:RimJ/RimL family protein N-acetyltransferase
MADVSIAPASSIALECCAVKTGLITGHYADNQLLLYDFLVNKRLALPGGHFSPGKLNRQLAYLTAEEINQLINRQSEIFGTESNDILRVFGILDKEDKIVISKAELDDAQLYFEWANDRVVRENSVHREPILWDEHIRWFNEKINSGNSTFYLFKTMDKRPLGQLRFEHEQKQNWINFSIDKNFRGQGLGEVVIKIAIQQLIREKPGVKEINAVVKPDNIASVRAFEHNSFQLKRTYSVNGEQYLEFKKKNHENRS